MEVHPLVVLCCFSPFPPFYFPLLGEEWLFVGVGRMSYIFAFFLLFSSYTCSQRIFDLHLAVTEDFSCPFCLVKCASFKVELFQTFPCYICSDFSLLKSTDKPLFINHGLMSSHFFSCRALDIT